MKNIVVFASGSGTNFQSIINSINRGDISARISGLITSKPNIGVIQKAHEQSIPVRVIPASEHNNENDFANKLLAQLKEWDTDLIVLAGYLKKIPAAVINEYPHRILNIHPSLLPKFGGKGYYGLRVHAAVIEANEKESGCSVHIVTEEFDEGPVIARSIVPVHKNDTPEELSKRILKEEHRLYPKAIQKYIKTLQS